MNKYIPAVLFVLAVWLGYTILTNPLAHSAYLAELEQCASDTELSRLGNIGRLPDQCAVSYQTWRKIRQITSKYNQEHPIEGVH